MVPFSPAFGEDGSGGSCVSSTGRRAPQWKRILYFNRPDFRLPYISRSL